MPNIRPSAYLRNNYNEVSEFCHSKMEPMFITKNGHGDLAVMSIEAYEKFCGRYELYHLLDESIEAGGYIIDELRPDEVIDLSQIDFEKLAQMFGQKSKHIKVEQLKCEVDKRLRRLLTLNKMRIGLAEKFQSLIDEYNAGSKNIEEFFKELMAFVGELDEEEQRAVREEMTEEELAVFDLILRPGPELNKDEILQVKKVARELLLSLKAQKLVLDWKKSQQNRAIVQRTIRDTIGEGLPDEYDDIWKKKKLNTLYEHFYESYEDAKTNVYVEV